MTTPSPSKLDGTSMVVGATGGGGGGGAGGVGAPELTITSPRQRVLLRDVAALYQERGRREEALQKEFHAATAGADRVLRTTKEEIEERFAAANNQAEAAFRAQGAKLTQQSDAEVARIKKEFETAKAQIAQKTDAEERSAVKALKDRIWAAETIYEGNEGKPSAEFEVTRREVEKKLQDHVATESAAGVVLAEYGQPLSPGETAEQPSGWVEPPGAPPERYETLAADSRDRVALLGRMTLPRFYSNLAVPVIVAILLTGGAAAGVAWQMGWKFTPEVGLGAGGMAIIAITALILLARAASRQVRRARGPLIWTMAAAREASETWLAHAALKRDQQAAALVAKRDEEIQSTKAKYEPVILEVRQRRSELMATLQKQHVAQRAEQDAWRERESAAVSQRRREALEAAKRVHESEIKQADAHYEQETRVARTRHEEQIRELTALWDEGTARVAAVHDAIVHDDRAFFKHWDDPIWSQWRPRTEPVPEIRFGELSLDLASLPGGLPKLDRLAQPPSPTLVLPAALALPDHASIFLKYAANGRAESIRLIQTLMLRLLLSLPPGKARFTIIDPVGLGESFAGFMHLADYEEALVGGKIWTETRHIEQRLVDLTEHMENVIQKYLRNEFRTIAEYNAQAGEIAEPYRFLVIADFPVNFNEQAAARLAAVCASGARCGVHTLIAMDSRQKPSGSAGNIQISDLERNSVRLTFKDNRFVWEDKDFAHLPLKIDEPPGEDAFNEMIHRIGVSAKDSNRVQVPFDMIAPGVEDLWTGDATSDLRVPLGRCGATKLQYLTLGRGTAQHMLIAGKTGSGKSTLLHALITNLSMWFSPDEVQFYLVDFKKGVEFKSYASHDLPHARAVAIESDREFGLSVLHRLDAELKRRGNLYRDLGVQDLAGFRRKAAEAGPPYSNERIPRTLLIIDEFQEFFTEDDKLAQDATLLLDRLVRQGRAFGIHVILGSQTLSGAYNLARSTMGQMGVRIALQCSEADSYMILSEDNAAARLLSRPGEAIYNDSSGLVEGNSPFQIAWLSDDQRDRYLERISAKAETANYHLAEPQAVFEGNVPSDVRRNRLLAESLAKRPTTSPVGVRIWLGDAIAIKDPTAAILRRQTSSNLLIIGQRDEAALAMMGVALAAIGGQCASSASVYLLDSTPPDALHVGFLERVASTLPQKVRIVQMREIAEAMNELSAELARRQGGEGGGSDDHEPVFFLVNGIHRCRPLRKAEDDFSFSSDDAGGGAKPDKQLAELLREGPPLGMHTMVWCDTAGNTTRALDRGGIKEFDWRVLFQMSATDSSMLIDAPEAGKLGLHRALLYSEEQGTIEKFRPYALPDESWLRDVAAKLRT